MQSKEDFQPLVDIHLANLISYMPLFWGYCTTVENVSYMAGCLIFF